MKDPTHHEAGMTPLKARKHGGRMEKKEEKKGHRKERKHGGKVEGKKPEHRMDKRARGGRMTPKSPFTGAGKMHGGVEDSDEDEEGGRRSGGRLTASDRNALPASDFANPGKGEGPEHKGSGSYPIPNERHGRLALAMVSKYGSSEEKARVRAKVHAKYPGIGKG